MSIEISKITNGHTITLRDMDEKTNIKHVLEIARANNIPVHDALVPIENFYESAFTGQYDTCPECSAPTESRFVNLHYATNVGERCMSAPFGHFCTQCPTLVIDDKSVLGVYPQHLLFAGVFRISKMDDNVQVDAIPKTFNGEKTYLCLSNDGLAQVLGISSSLYFQHVQELNRNQIVRDKVAEEAKRKQNQATFEKNKAKAKAAKQARKKQRK